MSLGLTSAQECLNCPPQTLSPPGSHSASACGPCPVGTFFSENISNCSLCSPGTFSDQTLATCALCSPGSFTSSDGGSACQLCAAGTYATASGQTTCSPCRPGTYWADADANCSAAGPELTCLDGSVGRIQYNGPESAVWTIAPPGTAGIALVFAAFNTTADADVLLVYACADAFCTVSAQLAALSGSRLPLPLLAAVPVMRLQWTATAPRSNTTRRGWAAQWTALQGSSRAACSSAATACAAITSRPPHARVHGAVARPHTAVACRAGAVRHEPDIRKKVPCGVVLHLDFGHSKS